MNWAPVPDLAKVHPRSEAGTVVGGPGFYSLVPTPLYDLATTWLSLRSGLGASDRNSHAAGYTYPGPANRLEIPMGPDHAGKLAETSRLAFVGLVVTLALSLHRLTLRPLRLHDAATQGQA